MSGGTPACSCLIDYVGAPPNCRPECVLNSECPSQQACISQRCQDPCPGSCGFDAECHVLSHAPICVCMQGYTGDPFTGCSAIPRTTERAPIDLCNPSPCGSNTQCRDGICSCLPEYQGDPYRGCRPECVLNTDCPRDKACLRNKCIDPCPGTCGQFAECDVNYHVPACSCPIGKTGDPFSRCYEIEEPRVPPKNPCQPSPCGPNSQCSAINNNAVCSCVAGYIGSPPGCRPECVVSSECSQDKACINQKCIDPCIGTCGYNARCEVKSHSPICGCPAGQTGDPFQRCFEIIKTPIEDDTPKDPCQPSPCGPNSICSTSGNSPVCQCISGYIGRAPNCKPECTINADCQGDKSCLNNKCVNPCPGVCGTNAECRVYANAVSCTCPIHHTGNPFVQCQLIEHEEINPCEPSPCGPNAECIKRNNVGSCRCISEYMGNPYEGCRPECVINSDCSPNLACIRNKCQDPCPGICGQNAECKVINHIPTCSCVATFVGDPFTSCQLRDPVVYKNPCQPSPCGPNSQCREINGQAVCSCAVDYTGSPPNCRPECTINTECSSDKACHKFKCRDPCRGTCGINAKCEVINHNPICSCLTGYVGDPFTRCQLKPIKPEVKQNPCSPSPCGLYAECRVVGDSASCSCLQTYIGSPPNCRPECLVNTDCPSSKACIAEKCRNPCDGSCGYNTECTVQNHIPNCKCQTGFTGDPFTRCTEIIEKPPPKVADDPCYPSPCGSNAQCREGICTCFQEYQGDPYQGCRPECVLNSECSPTKACIRNKCIDPCPGTCGQNANCDVINHLPTCSCSQGMAGDPFVLCKPRPKTPVNPCNPSPCGPNSQCRQNNGIATCSCQSGMVGAPPSCRPECVVSSDCDLEKACIQNKCRDPCPGTCGENTQCKVINHNPSCSCIQDYMGDPFTRCYIIQYEPKLPANPCQPSPCGANSQCRVVGESPACSCLPGMVGNAPNCKPECVSNNDCSNQHACFNQKCQDPCTGSCGLNAECRVINHNPVCTCASGYEGDPFRGCKRAMGE